LLPPGYFKTETLPIFSIPLTFPLKTINLPTYF
jgi:hypothetical protein